MREYARVRCHRNTEANDDVHTTRVAQTSPLLLLSSTTTYRVREYPRAVWTAPRRERKQSNGAALTDDDDDSRRPSRRRSNPTCRHQLCLQRPVNCGAGGDGSLATTALAAAAAAAATAGVVVKTGDWRCCSGVWLRSVASSHGANCIVTACRRPHARIDRQPYTDERRVYH